MSPSPDDGRDPDERIPLGSDEAARADDGSALSPEELDIEDEDNVVSLDEDRYVIGTDQRPSVSEDADEDDEDEDDFVAGRAAVTEAEATVAAASDLSSGTVKEWLENDLQGASARYGFHVTAKAEDAISHQQMFSDDVGAVFDSLLRWYAQQLTTETAVEDVLGILLTESNVRVRYSPSCLQAILEAYDLGPDDTIADLVEAVQDDRGMVFPPENV